MPLTNEPLRLAGALLLGAGWLGMSLRAWLASRSAAQRQRAAAFEAGGPEAGSWLVAHASQTGTAADLARRSAALLAAGGIRARAMPVDALDDAVLAGASHILFAASTYGEGDAPDDAARFAARMAARAPQSDRLRHLRYAVLALGDRSYANFCGFGRTLDGWLGAQGATRLFDRIDVDRGDPAALAAWRRELARIAGTADLPDWDGPAWGAWRIAERSLLNPGSAGGPLYLLGLAPVDGVLPAWEAGDLAQVGAPADPDRPREYSIASTPADGRLELLVRLQERPDGSAGIASGWLCGGAQPHDTVRLRVRPHERFRLAGNDHRPLILVGNGSGLAGLRGLLKARIGAGRGDNWLVFGERNAAHDFLLREELTAWRAGGWLAHLDLAFSRDGDNGAAPRYVQHVLRERAADVADWVRHGAAIYVCGSIDGMAAGVHAALEDILGADVLDALADEGRYRRDVY